MIGLRCLTTGRSSKKFLAEKGLALLHSYRLLSIWTPVFGMRENAQRLGCLVHDLIGLGVVGHVGLVFDHTAHHRCGLS